MQDEEFQQLTDAQRQQQSEQKRDDLNHEISGVETGRIKRHLPNKNDELAQQQRKEREHQTQLVSALEALMKRDPEYAALYNKAIGMITQSQIDTEQAIQDAETRLADALDTREKMLDIANRLPDGTIIVKDADGDVWTLDGEQVTDEVLLETIVWQDGAPSREEYAYHQKNGLD